jgi:tetratricopeptide (TPR) repeat protein
MSSRDTRLEQRFAEAKRLHQAGDVAGAAEAYRKILEADPQHADALHLSGVILQQQGRVAEAIARIGAAIELDPKRAGFRANLAVSLRAAGRGDEALAQLREAARLEPGYLAGRRNLGVFLCGTGEWEEACGHLEAALVGRSSDAAAMRKLGLARLMLGRTGEAEPVLRRAVEVDPANVEGRNQLAVALKRLGRAAEAEECLREALRLRPDDAGTLTNLGDILNTLGRHDDALPLLEKAVQLNPRGVEALNNLAMSLEALERFDEAAARLKTALEINPDYTPALNNLANDLLRRGRSSDATACLQRVAVLEPRHVPAWYALAANTRHLFTADEIELVESLIADPRTAAGTRGMLRFGMAAAYDRLARPDDSFRHAIAANRWRKSDNAQRGITFDRDRHRQRIDDLIRSFSAGAFARIPQSGCESDLPVFVLGMPRSGTTLVEQILASHSQVRGAGELDDMLHVALALLVSNGESLITGLTQDALRTAADRQLARYRTLAGDAIRLVDKTTVNFLHLGLIAMMFPKARVIHCTRDARDTCLSCFLHNFASPGLSFAFDLADLGAFYREYERLMAHWRATLPLPMMDIPYDDLVSDPERWSRAMVDFCGLEWDSRCLEFHRSDRIIHTASAQQVREPVHKRSVNRWKAYERHLRPLFDALEGRAPAESQETNPVMIRAIALHREGRLHEARELYRETLAREPASANAMQLLGLLEHQLGRSAEGLTLIDRAIAMEPASGEFHSNRAAVLNGLGRVKEALASLERSVELDPSYATAWRNLAVLSDTARDHQRAEFAWRRLVELDPSSTTWRGFGRSLLRHGRNDEAEQALRRAVTADPRDVESWDALGIVLRELERFQESEQCHREALRIAPERAEFHLHLGVLFTHRDRTAEALAAFDEALRLDPANVDARHNRGAVLATQMRDEEAIDEFRRALALKNNEVEVHNSLGASLFSLGRFDEAMAAIDAALQIDPEHGLAHFNRAQCLLLRGNWERGFEDWEWRWKRPGVRDRRMERPAWRGDSRPNAALLVYAEQGLGDTLMCLRFLSLARNRVARVVVECQEPLVPLMKLVPGVDEVVARGERLPPVDAQVAMMTLPAVFDSRPANVAGLAPPQLEVPPHLIDRWRSRLAGGKGFRVGLSWQGNSRFKRDALRSIPLREFAPLAKVGGVHWIALQQGPALDQAKDNPPFPIKTLEPDDSEGLRPFLDSAAIIRQLDLVITSDTALAHLAGAIGAPVWIALPHVPDWRWLMSGSDCPWYPSAQLFRERRRGDWEFVFENIATKLAALAGQA